MKPVRCVVVPVRYLAIHAVREQPKSRIADAFRDVIAGEARLPLPPGWDYTGVFESPGDRTVLALIEHECFDPIDEDYAVPRWPVFSTRALAHLTLCGETSLDA